MGRPLGRRQARLRGDRARHRGLRARAHGRAATASTPAGTSAPRSRWSSCRTTTRGCATPARSSSPAGDNRLGIDFAFNGWGGKFAPHDADDALPEKLCEYLGIPRERAEIVLEGGSISVDGEGTLVTTEQCLLDPSRNPELDKDDLEEALHPPARLGADRLAGPRAGRGQGHRRARRQRVPVHRARPRAPADRVRPGQPQLRRTPRRTCAALRSRRPRRGRARPAALPRGAATARGSCPTRTSTCATAP